MGKQAQGQRQQNQLQDKQKEEINGRGVLFQSEFDYLAFFREKRRLSPRAIAQGFVINIEQNILHYREMVTDNKVGTSRQSVIPPSLRIDV